MLGSGLFLVATGSRAQAQFMPTRHVRQEIANGRTPMLNRLPSNQTMRLNIMLSIRNEPELDELLRDLYNPESVLYHQFLSTQEFTKRFGPTEEDYAEVIHFARRNGLKITGTFANRMVVNVAGSVTDVERAFQVQMNTYRHPTENRSFYAPDREPTPDLTVPL
jgi:subtilase family serine protease